ncbi:unnamed protein product [Microthlaspi erraticum]|uniref:DDE Tnp4 domain-containing protein n=1 Tax=Microthlaspi erraticum TaxID=1685480 RepID=A0A6D2JT82_9BRAS|nr:unnamed protein product [Microthlaspi erraticum]
MQLRRDYFDKAATYPTHLFRRRFRMNMSLFLRIVNDLKRATPDFEQQYDALGKPGFTALQKCTAAIRILAYGSAADAVDEYLRMSASSASSFLESFVEGIIQVFGNKYLRRPTPEDLQRLLDKGAERGFPGMIGSIDCMHWEWKNCPTAWKGQYSRGFAKPTIALEAVASHDLWIWHTFFGAPGTLNDLNILDRSPVFDDIINGQAPPVNFSVNGNEYHLGYYLADGIYPAWATFIPTIKIPVNPKQKLFAKLQEAFWKDVERAFGVLQARFAIIKNPALCMDKVKIEKIMRACIILHNMIVEDERDGDYDEAEFQPREGNISSDVRHSDDMPTNVEEMMGVRVNLRDEQRHQQLKYDLVENVWETFGHLY